MSIKTLLEFHKSALVRLEELEVFPEFILLYKAFGISSHMAESWGKKAVASLWTPQSLEQKFLCQPPNLMKNFFILIRLIFIIKAKVHCTALIQPGRMF